ISTGLTFSASKHAAFGPIPVYPDTGSQATAFFPQDPYSATQQECCPVLPAIFLSSHALRLYIFPRDIILKDCLPDQVPSNSGLYNPKSNRKDNGTIDIGFFLKNISETKLTGAEV